MTAEQVTDNLHDFLAKTIDNPAVSLSMQQHPEIGKQDQGRRLSLME
jgi:hypothetical protein